jgi:hypothetical protein
MKQDKRDLAHALLADIDASGKLSEAAVRTLFDLA